MNENGHVETDCRAKEDCHVNENCHARTDCWAKVDCQVNWNGRVNENCHAKTDCQAKVKCHANGNCRAKTDCQARVDCHVNGSCHVNRNCHMRVDGRAGEVESAEWIQGVLEGGKMENGVSGEIIVDSGAAESVCPWGWAEQFPIQEVTPGQERSFVNASGGRMGHYGERQVVCGVQGLSAPVAMKFQVSDARHPLASVARITEQGNIVQFGPQPQDNYIYNPLTDEKVLLRKKGKKFIMDVNFLGKSSLFSGQA